MRAKECAERLEERRRVAVDRVLEGYEPQEVADFLGVEVRSVYRWLAAYRQNGTAGLVALSGRGRPRKLDPDQTEAVLSWLGCDPQEFGFPTSRWTAPRLAMVVQGVFGVRFHPGYLNAWLQAQGISPQIPSRVARERDPQAIDRWMSQTWPAIKKSPPERSRHYVQ
jgi:transposase